jgi:hypothetical protein
LFPLFQDEWSFCREPNCRSSDRVDGLQSRFWGRLWLQQIKLDPLRIRILRDVLSQQISLPPSRVADDTVLEQIAELLNSGRLHIHARKRETYAAGGAISSQERSAVAFPLAEHLPRRPEPAPRVVDPPSFPPKANLTAQAAALVAAAAAGTPFCPV